MTTLVIAHEAGCVHALEAWMRADQSSDYVRDYDTALTGIDKVVVGTSAVSHEEQNVLALAKAKGIPTIAYVDGPYSIPERFTKVYPDIIWVSDSITMQACINELPVNVYAQILPAYYQQEFIDKGPGLKVLFLSQPIEIAMKEVNKDYGYTEYEALKTLISYLNEKPKGHLKIRYHPREIKSYSCHKFNRILDLLNPSFKTSHSVDVTNQTLAADIQWADWVVGMDTPAMAIAVSLGKRVLCSIPNNLKMKSEDKDIQYIYDIRT